MTTRHKLTFSFSRHRGRHAAGSFQPLSEWCFNSRKHFWSLRTRGSALRSETYTVDRLSLLGLVNMDRWEQLYAYEGY